MPVEGPRLASKILAVDKTGGHGLLRSDKNDDSSYPRGLSSTACIRLGWPVCLPSLPPLLFASLSSNNASGRNNAISDFGKGRRTAAGIVPPFYQRNYFYAIPYDPCSSAASYPSVDIRTHFTIFTLTTLFLAYIYPRTNLFNIQDDTIERRETNRRESCALDECLEATDRRSTLEIIRLPSASQ